MLSGNSLRQTVHTHRASVQLHQAAQLVAALLRVLRVTAGLAESNISLQARFMTHVTCRLTAKIRDQLGTLRSAIEYGLPFLLKHSIHLSMLYTLHCVFKRDQTNDIHLSRLSALRGLTVLVATRSMNLIVFTSPRTAASTIHRL